MALIASIVTANTYSQFPEPGLEVVYADVYISLTDSATGNPTNGDNAVVEYQKITNTTIGTHQVTIPGQSIMIQSGILRTIRTDDFGAQHQEYYTTFNILNIGAPNPSPPVNICNLTISYINIEKFESSPGANDAKIVVSASSTYPIQYSLDNVHFQSSRTFNGLSGGSKTVYVKDGNPLGCAVSRQITIPTNERLLASDPTITVGNNISRWNAAFNPIVFTYQRKDFAVTSVTNDYLTGYAAVATNTFFDDSIKGENIYINAGPYKGTFTVKSYQENNLVIDVPYTTTASGFININHKKDYYKLLTLITYQDAITGQQSTITSTNRPDNKGLIKADLSNFLQSLLRAKDESEYTETNYRDTNLSASYQIAYAEVWNEGDIKKQTEWITIAEPYYVVYAAKQLGNLYGGNLAEYVPFKSVLPGAPLAKWIVDFTEPVYSNTYPFDLGFIYGEDVAGLNLYASISLLDINRNPVNGLGPVYLLNEDSSFLLNQDSGKLIIADGISSTTGLAEHIGLNRLLINYDFDDDVYYFVINIAYKQGADAIPVFQDQTVRIDKKPDHNSVYLRWIGLSGAWNYYRFTYNQEISLDVQNATIIKNFISDWENQQGIEEVISKSAGQKMKVMAEDLSVADIKGLQSIKYSPKVQMLVNKNPVKWQTVVLNTATFSEYETLNGQAPFSVTFNLPSINIQTQ